MLSFLFDVVQSMSMGPEIAPGSGVPLAAAPGSPGFAMGLAVPGLTVPWGHAGYLWLATAASIAFHEARTREYHMFALSKLLHDSTSASQLC